jgi:hypothetical protein
MLWIELVTILRHLQSDTVVLSGTLCELGNAYEILVGEQCGKRDYLRPRCYVGSY